MARVLVVDDSAIDQQLIGGLLKDVDDLNVEFANDGQQALDSVTQDVPDLVVTDLEMPVMNGLELIQSLRDPYPLLPIIMVTARGSEELAVQALEAGASSYVPKRRLQTALAETITRILAVAREERAQAQLMTRMVENDCKFVVENDLTLVTALVAYFRQGVQGAKLGHQGDSMRVGTALEEALINAYYHGNLEVSSELREEDDSAYYELANQRSRSKPYQDRRIHVQARLRHSEAVYVIRDEGPGFDTSQIPDPTDPENLNRPSGRGLLLMRSFMDEVIYNDSGNEVTLIKRHSNGQ